MRITLLRSQLTQAHEADFALDGELANLFRALASYSRQEAWSDIIQFVQALDIFLELV